MTIIEMDAENDKITKSFNRYKFMNGIVRSKILLNISEGSWI